MLNGQPIQPLRSDCVHTRHIGIVTQEFWTFRTQSLSLSLRATAPK